MIRLSKKTKKVFGKVFSGLLVPVALIAQIFSPITTPMTQSVLAASYNVTFHRLSGPRYNSAFTFNNGSRMKIYTNRMFNIRLNGRKSYCIAPLYELNGGPQSGEEVSLTSALSQLGHSNASAIARRLSLFAYYTENPTSAVQSAINQHNISSDDLQVATQYFIWESLGGTFVDDEYGPSNLGDSDLGINYEHGVDYTNVWRSRWQHTASYKYTGIFWRFNGIDWEPGTGLADRHEFTTGSYTATMSSQAAAAAETKELSKSDSGFRTPNTVNGDPMTGEGSQWGNGSWVYFADSDPVTENYVNRGYYERVSTKWTVTHYSIPAWYRALKTAVNDAINFQLNLTVPTFDASSKTGVVNQTVTFTRTGGSTLANFFRDSAIPTSKPSTPNYGGHTYVWYSGNNLYMQGTVTSPDGFFNVQLLSNKSAVNGGESKAVLWNNPSSQHQAFELTANLDSLRLSLRLQVLKYGDLEISKTTTENTHQSVQGARFGVYRSYTNGVLSDPVTETATTGANGKILVKDLIAVGPAPDYNIGVTYYVKELSVPEPWTLDTQVYPVHVRPSETTYYTSTNNPAYGRITFTKLDSETGSTPQGEATLIGARFRVTLISSPYFPNKVGYSEEVTIGNDLTAQTSDKMPLGVYSVTEITAPTGYQLKDNISNVEIAYQGQNTYVVLVPKTVEDDVIKGRVSVVKTDNETGDVLRNATFYLRRNFANGDKSLVDVITTDANGVATTGYHPYGNYQLIEVTTPYGYTENLDDKSLDVHDVFIDTNNRTYNISQTNPYQYGDIEINKQNVLESFYPWTNSEISLAGAVYEIRAVNMFVERTNPRTDSAGRRNGPYHYDNGALVATLTTDENGFAKTDRILPLGVYDLVEISSPTGYMVNQVSVRFTIDYDGQTVKYSSADSQNSNNSNTLIAYYNQLQDALYNTIIPANSPQDIGNLHEFKVKPAPLNPQSVDNSKIVTTNERPRLGRIEITKQLEDFDDTQGGQSGGLTPERGIKFEVRNHEGEVVDTIITNSSGWGTSNYLPYGTYTIVQENLDSPAGEIDPFEVEIAKDYDLQVHQFALKNSITPYRLKLIKVDSETGKTIPIAGVTFQIFEQETGGNPLVLRQWSEDGYKDMDTFTTRENGTVTLPQEIPYGTYYLQEIKAPEGYYLDPNGGRLAIDVKGPYTDVTVHMKEIEVPNTPQKGILQINKVGDILASLDEVKLPSGILAKLQASGAVLENGVGTVIVDNQVPEQFLNPTFVEGYLGGAVYELRAREDIVGKEGTVHYRKGDVVQTLTTGFATLLDENGEEIGNAISNELPLGQYELQEIAAPEGYILDATVYEIDFTPQHQSVRLDIQSHKQENIKQNAKFTFTKAIEESQWFESHKDALEQIVFGLFTKEEIVYQGFTVPANTFMGYTTLTETDGVLGGSFDTMLAGNYYIQELSTAEQYVLDSTQHDVNFTYDSEGQPSYTIEYEETIENDLHRVELVIQKVDSENGTGLVGTVFKLYAIGSNQEQTLIGEYVTGESGVLTIHDLEYGTYYLEEVLPSGGYWSGENPGQTVIIDGSTNSGNVIIEKENEKNTIDFAKVDAETGQPVVGATLQLLDSAGNVIDEWITSDVNHSIVGVLQVGNTYTLREVKTPSGYVTAKDIVFVMDDKPLVSITMIDYPTITSISKVDIANGAEIEGAHMSITDEDGNVIDSWISGKDPHIIKYLEVGKKYFLREDLAPIGYATANEIEFILVDENIIQSVTMYDEPLTVEISKWDITNEKELAGATLQIIDEAGNVVYEWVSTNEPHVIQYIPLGKYILRETIVPDGYVTSVTDVEFEITDTGLVQKVKMDNEMIKTVISKQDITNGEELVGAHLTVYDKDGNIVDSWISTDTPHEIYGLLANETYVLRESLAPIGYAIATDVEFTIDGSGIVNEVTMVDDIIKVEISKKDITNNEELAGATLQIIDSEGNVIHEWVSTDEAHYIEKMAAGEYTLRELTAPDGYAIAEDVKFTVTATGEIQYVEMFDDVIKVEISKKDITNGKELPGAKLQIIDKDGNVIHEWISTDKPHYIEKLAAGTYTLREITAPNGYEIAEDVIFTVTATGEIQHVEMFDEPSPTPPSVPTWDDSTTPISGFGITASSTQSPLFGFMIMGIAALIILPFFKRKDIAESE